MNVGLDGKAEKAVTAFVDSSDFYKRASIYSDRSREVGWQN